MSEMKLLLQGVSVPERYVRTWEEAYRSYGQAFEIASQSDRDDPMAAYRMMVASRHVASAWRSLATAQDLPWWVLAALQTSAASFESQASEWQERCPRVGSGEAV